MSRPSRSILFAGALGALLGCQSTFAAVEGSGIRKEEKRAHDGFEAVEISHALEVEVVIADAFEVRVIGDDNLLPRVKTSVSGNRLSASMGRGGVQPKLGLKVFIKLPVLKDLEASGAARVTVQGLRGGELTIDASGASEIRLAGQAGALAADVSGASRIDGRKLTVDVAKLDVSGASRVEVRAKKSVTGDASGASRVEVLGSPATLEVETSGASSVKRAG